MVSKCKYCGKSFTKTHNKQKYCSEKCREYAVKEQKLKYQLNRKRLIKKGELISYTNDVGTTYLPCRSDDFNKEHEIIQRELNRIKKGGRH